MKTESVISFCATIYVGFRVGRTSDPNPRLHTEADAMAIVQQFANDHEGKGAGGCVSVTPTRFVYVRGSEPGIAVGFINYPRFPTDFYKIREQATELATRLMDGLEQMTASIVFPDETVLLRREVVA